MRFLVGALLIAFVGCYDVPSPACGFACGPAGECPSGYTCNNASELADYRCHPSGALLEIDPELCPPARSTSVEDPRPRVFQTLEMTSPLTPSLSLITITFTKLVHGIDGTTVRLTRDDGERVAVGIDAGEGITMTALVNFPPFTLVVGHSYSIEVSGNIFDSRGYRLVPYHYTFTVDNDLPPFITTRVPGIDEMGVSVDPDLYFELDENVFFLDASVLELRRNGVLVPTELAPVGGHELNSLYVKATKQLTASTVYTLTVLPTFQDQGGNVFPGDSWSFTTGADLVAPRVLRSPDGEFDVSVARTFVIELDERVLPVDGTTVQLVKLPDETAIDATITFDAVNFVAFIDPTMQLPPDTTFRVRVGLGMHDGAGNQLLTKDVVFRTGTDFVGPRVTSTSPQAASSGAPRNATIDIAFDESVLPPMTGDMVVTVNDVEVTGTATQLLSTSWRFVPQSLLPANTPIRVEVLVDDLHGNSAFYSYELTTGP